VGFSSGGITGNAAQVFAQGMKKYLPNPQTVLVDFKPGAASAVGADFVLKQPADGHTLFVFLPDICIKVAKDGPQLAFNIEDFINIGTYFFSPHIMAVSREKSPFKSFDDFLDAAKKNPGKISYGLSGGFGSNTHLSVELLMSECGIKLNQVPFRGAAPTLANVLGGHVDCAVFTPGSAGDHIMPGGGLRTLIVLGPERLPALPDVPTCLEKGYNVNRGVWNSLAAAKGTPKPVVEALVKICKKTADDPQVKAGLRKLRVTPWNLGPEETKKNAQKQFNFAKEFFKKKGS
jgi:tripartite-type tricarboxylate transporter receptor subunit TctC